MSAIEPLSGAIRTLSRHRLMTESDPDSRRWPLILKNGAGYRFSAYWVLSAISSLKIGPKT
jgi:hypothetical protein